jgi:hypothetical protein
VTSAELGHMTLYPHSIGWPLFCQLEISTVMNGQPESWTGSGLGLQFHVNGRCACFVRIAYLDIILRCLFVFFWDLQRDFSIEVLW